MKMINGICDDLGCWVGELPSGCKLCMDGLKTVIFITGLCTDRCYYCPISNERRGVDIVYVNEVKLHNPEDFKTLELEIIASGSKGAGITGGDPLLVYGRTVKYIVRLKKVFDDKFHIHLYTSGTKAHVNMFKELNDLGLDEIRFHIVSKDTWRAIEHALKYDMDVVIEVPAIPNSKEWLLSLILKAEELGVKYVNVNELEVSESNYDALIMRGFKFNDDGVTVVGSESAALEVLKLVNELGVKVNVHYCPSVFKDRYQLRRRLMRRGLRTKYVFEELSDGLVRWARVNKESCKDVINYVLMDMIIDDGSYYLINPKLIGKLDLTKCKGEFIEAYPTGERLHINLTPLNDKS